MNVRNAIIMANEVVELCKACGVAIDRIAHDCDVNQDIVAEKFMDTMRKILDKMKEEP